MSNRLEDTNYRHGRGSNDSGQYGARWPRTAEERAEIGLAQAIDREADRLLADGPEEFRGNIRVRTTIRRWLEAREANTELPDDGTNWEHLEAVYGPFGLTR